jgi:hypothetical protein
MNHSVASIPEPAPQRAGFVVPEKLIIHLADLLDGSNDTQFERLIHLIEQRDAFGRQKYGQPLMSQDGRDGCEDARQELGDLMQSWRSTAATLTAGRASGPTRRSVTGEKRLGNQIYGL